MSGIRVSDGQPGNESLVFNGDKQSNALLVTISRLPGYVLSSFEVTHRLRLRVCFKACHTRPRYGLCPMDRLQFTSDVGEGDLGSGRKK
jgi:hypothetical protein